MICVSAAAYFPLSAIYPPWQWVGVGPFEVHPLFAPQFVIYFLLGLAVGAYGYDRGLLDGEGSLVRRWPMWTAGCFASFLLWIIPAALIMKVPDVPVASLTVAGNFGFVMFVAAACFSMMAIFLRFASVRWPIVDGISENAYGIYLLHYVFVLWLQFGLRGLAIPAIGKGAIVLVASLLLSWALSVLAFRILKKARCLVGLDRKVPGARATGKVRISAAEFPE